MRTLVEEMHHGTDLGVIDLVDLLLLGEFAWCTIWLRHKQIHDTILYIGGVGTAGYVSWLASNWVTAWFARPSSTAFLWLEQHLTTDSTAVNALSWMIPAEPVEAKFTQANWIAIHVAHSLVYITLTGGVFLVFLIVVYLRQALWDMPSRSVPDRANVVSGIFALCGSIYVVLLTGLLLNDVAWIRDCGWLVLPVQSSLVIQSISYLVQHLIVAIA